MAAKSNSAVPMVAAPERVGETPACPDSNEQGNPVAQDSHTDSGHPNGPKRRSDGQCPKPNVSGQSNEARTVDRNRGLGTTQALSFHGTRALPFEAPQRDL